jgi:phosphatidylglycerophosphate synthase
MSKEHLNYFSKKEKEKMNKIKDTRTNILLPISKFLKGLGLTANMVSYIGFFILIGFIYFVTKNPILASFFLLAHVLIDAFDGPLARLEKKDGDSGAFTDIICDHTGMVIVVCTLIFINLVNAVLASIYIYIYTIMIIFIIIRNRLKVPIKFVLRTKYYIYLLYAIWAIFNVNYFNYGLIIFIIIMLPETISSYFILKKALEKKQ